MRYEERELFIDALWMDVGLKQVPLHINKYSHSESSYTLRKKISLAVNSITSFSSKPLVYIFYIGIATTLFSLLYIVYLLYSKFTLGVTVEGWAGLMASIWFIGGVILFCMGVLGIYMAKMFIEVKHRPYTLIRKIYRKDSSNE